MNLTLLTLLAEGFKTDSNSPNLCQTPIYHFEKKPLTFLGIPTDELISHFAVMEWPIRDNMWYMNKWQNPTDRQQVLKTTSTLTSKVWKDKVPATLPKITPHNIKETFKRAEEVLLELKNIETKLRIKKVILPPRTPAYTHQVLFRRLHPNAYPLVDQGHLADFATTEIAKKFSMTFSVVDLAFMEMENPRCNIVRYTCDPKAPFRNINATCNNLVDPRVGSSFTRFRRLAAPDYADGVSALKASLIGTPLPSARLVSTTVNLPEKDPGGQAVGNCFTTLHMTFGQFLDHDITFTPVNTGDNGTTITCCSPEVINDPTLLHPECAPIDIPLDDPFYSAFGKTCMEFVRSAPSDRCKLGPREQLNQRTHYIDHSTIYGSTDEEATSLRKNQHGLLRTQDQGADPDLLPPSLNRDDDCNTDDNFARGQFCFVSGDDRVNEQILLTVLHTIWVREHNRIATTLKQLNPSWNDERLYQEARRINIAEMQHITYNEFLPGVLGPLVVEWLGLAPKKHGEFTNNYDPNISASISSEFATAALRFGHSMIPSSLREVNSAGVSQARELNSVLFAPFPLYENGVEEKLVRGETSQAAMKVDSKFTSQVTGKLFRGSQSFGLDLVALNIQRGRDHGLASYITVREACGFSRVNTFEDLVPFMVSKSLDTLRKTYKRVEDIELFVGGVSEKPVAGGQVGPTFACILGEQFIRLKRGDRFWYEYSGSPNPFTREQLNGLQKVSLARILCDNHPQSNSIRRWPLNLPNPFNSIVSCDCPIIPSLNLAMWKE